MISFDFLNVGQGDSTVIDLPGDQFAVVDFGTERAGEKVVLPAIQRRLAAGKTFLLAAITHWDDDHAGGLPAVFSLALPRYGVQANVSLDTIEQWLRQHDNSPRGAISSLEHYKNSPIRRIRLGAGNAFDCTELPASGPVVVRGLAPDFHVEKELDDILRGKSPCNLSSDKVRSLRNRSSLALYVGIKGRGAILLGEVENDQYDFIWESFRSTSSVVSPSVVKLSHHGSRHNNPAQVFAHFGGDGKVMVTSAGGRYGHPDVTVMDMVRESGAIPVCTNLGRGCELLIQHGVRPGDLNEWRKQNEDDIHRSTGPVTKCYSDIRVDLRLKESLEVSSSSTQERCPFGGPSVVPLLL